MLLSIIQMTSPSPKECAEYFEILDQTSCPISMNPWNLLVTMRTHKTNKRVWVGSEALQKSSCCHPAKYMSTDGLLGYLKILIKCHLWKTKFRWEILKIPSGIHLYDNGCIDVVQGKYKTCHCHHSIQIVNSKTAHHWI